MLLKKFKNLLLPASLLSACAPMDKPTDEATKLADSTDLQKPNIVWISCEDMSPRLPMYGDSTAQTPNLNQLAARGITYTNAFSVSGVCAPSRSSIITGMYPVSIGSQHMRTIKYSSAARDKMKKMGVPIYEAIPPAEVKCFTEYLRANGYYCTNQCKQDYQFYAPVTAWDQNCGGAHWRNRPNKNTPFFSVFNFDVTHESQMWKREDLPLTVNPDSVPVPPYYPNTPTVRRQMALHYSNIEALDKQVGQIINQLEEDGLLDNTIIWFWSDHGDGLPRAKRTVYDAGLQIALIAAYPNAKDAGSQTDRLVSFVDFAPTTLSLAGLKPPAHMQGKAFAGTFETKPRNYIYAARDRMDTHHDRIRAVRNKQFKYMRHYLPQKPYYEDIPYRNQMTLMNEIKRVRDKDSLSPEQKLWFRPTKPKEELFDTQKDPHELNNLATNPEYADKLAELRQKHLDFQEKYGDLGMMDEQEMVKTKLWLNGKKPTTLPAKISYKKTEKDVIATLTPETPGASLAYKMHKNDPWNLYYQPMPVHKGDTIYIKAHRIGYNPADVQVMVVD